MSQARRYMQLHDLSVSPLFLYLLCLCFLIMCFFFCLKGDGCSKRETGSYVVMYCMIIHITGPYHLPNLALCLGY